MWLLHYGDGLSIAEIAELDRLDVARVAAAIRSVDSAIVRRMTRLSGRVGAVRLRDAHGRIVASEILTDAHSVIDPDVRCGLSPRRTRTEIEENRRENLKKDLHILRERCQRLRDTYWFYTPADVQAEYDLLETYERRAAREGISA